MANISRKKLKESDILERIRFAFYADTDAFKKAFADKGILVEDETDLIMLADFSKRGADRNGEAKKKDGTPIKFNVMEIVYDFDINLDKLDSSGIKLVE